LDQNRFDIKFNDKADYGTVEVLPKWHSGYAEGVTFSYQMDLSTIVFSNDDLIFDSIPQDLPYSNFEFNLFERLKKIDSELNFTRLDLTFEDDFTRGYELVVPCLSAKEKDSLFCGKLVIDNYKIDLQKYFAY